MKNLLLTAFSIALLAIPALSQNSEVNVYDDDSWETYIGYQFVRQNIKVEKPDFSFNRDSDLNGLNTSVTFYPSENYNIGITGELGANFDTKSARNGLYTVMGGAVIKDRTRAFQPFARVLAGTAVNRADDDLRIVPRRSDFGFAGAVGGGADVKVSNRLKLRLIQVDYLFTNTYGDSQHNLRLGAGLVF